MTKLIKVTSLIGILVQSFLALMWLVYLILTITGTVSPDLTTTVNGEVTVQDEDTSKTVFSMIFGGLLVFYLISILLGVIGLKKMTNQPKKSGTFYIIGAIVSLNMITFIAWLICGISLKKESNNQSTNINQVNTNEA